jgi:acyl-coenzyme A synthetase/AMP-(fatty) acid ligase
VSGSKSAVRRGVCGSFTKYGNRHDDPPIRKLALDLHPDDIFWCTADPGWVTGTSYGIIAPLMNGVTSIIDEGDFDAERWYAILQEQKVTVWYTAPTAIRMLMKAGTDLARRYDLRELGLPEGDTSTLESTG